MLIPLIIGLRVASGAKVQVNTDHEMVGVRSICNFVKRSQTHFAQDVGKCFMWPGARFVGTQRIRQNDFTKFSRGGREWTIAVYWRIVTGWQAIMKAIFPETIDGDLLKLVHLSNGFRMIGGAKPLVVGDVCHSEAQVAAVINNDSGKVVKVKGHVIRDGKPVIEVVSSFFFRG